MLLSIFAFTYFQNMAQKKIAGNSDTVIIILSGKFVDKLCLT